MGQMFTSTLSGAIWTSSKPRTLTPESNIHLYVRSRRVPAGMLPLIHYCVATVFRQPISESEISLRKAWLRVIVEMKKKKGGFGEFTRCSAEIGGGFDGSSVEVEASRLG